ncbi:MAG: RNA polymerase sigma factor SigB [Sporolactobacillus sp.]|nr:RNA polymerase sigma factor SigB [Sporolactobacillus sp.]
MPTKSRPQPNEIREWLQAYRQNTADEALQQKLVDHYADLVSSLAGRFVRKKDIKEDLYQVGMIGLIAALNRFDPLLGCSFESFAVPTIIGEIKRYIRDQTWSVHVPRRIKELGPKVRLATEQLTISLQRAPTITEIASSVGESEETVLEAIELSQGYRSLSVDSHINGGPGRDSLTLLDVVGRHDDGFETVDKRIMLERALTILTAREKAVILCVYYENLSQKETGNRLDVSQMHVSRIQRRALQKLREALQTD